MEVARPPLLVALVVTCALALTARDQPPRSAAIALRSETALHNFGAVIAADGPRLALVDRAAGDAYIVRIERVDHGRLSSEARIPIPATWKLPSIDLRGETLVVHTDSYDLLVFRRVRGRWLRTQTLTLPTDCHDPFFGHVHLGDGVLVVESRNVFCVVEQSSAGLWSLSAALPRPRSTEISVNRARIFIASGTGAVQLERRREGWQPTATFDVPEAGVFDIATSDRWVVLRASGSRLHVFDLDAGGRESALIRPTKGHDIRTFAVGANTLVAADDVFGLEWQYSGTWSDQSLLEGPQNDSGFFPITIGNMIWIGAPEITAGRAGRILGYDRR